MAYHTNFQTIWGGRTTESKALIVWLIAFSLLCCQLFAVAKSSDRPNSNTHRGIVFNSYHPGKDRWKGPLHNELLFTWFTSATLAKNRQEYMRLLKNQQENGVKYIGYTYSSTLSCVRLPASHHVPFPERAIPPEAIKHSWIVRDANNKLVTWPNQDNWFFLDVGIREVQDAVLKRAIRNAKDLKANTLLLDNWYYKYWAPGDMEEPLWTKKCLSFLKRARELTGQNNLKLVVNTPSPPRYWPEFAPFLDGIAYEMGANPNRLKTKRLYEEELSSYEKVLAGGKSVFLYANRLTHPNGGRWDEDGRKVAATAMLVVPEDQPYWGGIYVCPPRYEVWPVGGWPMWPEQLGRPLGPRQWNGDTVTRKFDRGSISVTAQKEPKFNINFEY